MALTELTRGGVRIMKFSDRIINIDHQHQAGGSIKFTAAIILYYRRRHFVLTIVAVFLWCKLGYLGTSAQYLSTASRKVFLF